MQLFHSSVKLVLPMGIISLFAACGGGGGGDVPGGVSGGGDATAASTTTVSAFLTKAPVTGATCHLFNANDQMIAGPATSNAGAIQFNAVSHAGDVYTECSGGSYTDEATGSTV